MYPKSSPNLQIFEKNQKKAKRIRKSKSRKLKNTSNIKNNSFMFKNPFYIQNQSTSQSILLPYQIQNIISSQPQLSIQNIIDFIFPFPPQNNLELIRKQTQFQLKQLQSFGIYAQHFQTINQQVNQNSISQNHSIWNNNCLIYQQSFEILTNGNQESDWKINHAKTQNNILAWMKKQYQI